MDLALITRVEAARRQVADNSARLALAVGRTQALCRYSRDRRLDRAVLRACRDAASQDSLVRTAQDLIAQHEAWALVTRNLRPD